MLAKPLSYPRLFFLLLVFTFGLTACNFTLAADVTPPPGGKSTDVSTSQEQATSSINYPIVAPNSASGGVIFIENCAPCHGSTGLGDGERAASLPNPVIAISSLEFGRNAIPSELFNVVTQGNLERFMPPFPDLTDRQRWDVIAYVLTLSEPSESIATGNSLYQANCAGCHGEQGKGDGLQAVGANLPDFTDQEFMANKSADDFYQVISNGTGSMPAYSEQLPEAERWSLAYYLRSLSLATNGSPVEEANAQGAQDNLPGDPITNSEVISPTLLTGTISGMVENLSGSDLPVGVEVILHGFDEMQMVISQTTQVQADGSYSFPGVEIPAGRMFFTSLQHQGATYGSEVSTAQGGDQKIDLPIAVYDTTSDPSTIKIDRLHIFFEQADTQTMRIAELLVMSNTGNKTVIPGKDGQPSISFKLPAGFQDLQFQDGELGGRFLPTQDGFSDTASIYPGQGNYQVLLAYTLPYKRKLQISQMLTLPADAIVILAPDNLKVRGDSLEGAGTRDMGGTAFQMFNHAGLSAGEEIKVTITSGGFSLGGSSQLGLVIGMAALGLALVGGGAWMYFRNRKVDGNGDLAEPELSDKPEIPVADSREALMDAILALDDQYQAGQLPEEAYRQRRAILKDRLKELMS